MDWTAKLWIRTCETSMLRLAMRDLAKHLANGTAEPLLGMEPEERLRRYAVELERRDGLDREVDQDV